ncbi:ABC transporter permease [Nocardiopsis ansamitocini]|uniref:Transport permease protein n=1 Tax=Nocardiopsis ansamitocini TaxID=1670832 RepID=A0A9W6UIK0_9ACTN|nr:ABC transporter permease [Nocardiopsis ansamitocini]GLU47508.1 transport permease protein [Nocardiopsis ansamitocini]
MATTTTAPTARSTEQRSAVNPLRQTLRLTRTEFTLFYRYRMALYAAVLPLVFLVPVFSMGPGELLPGIDAVAFSLTNFFAMAAMTIGVVHVSNVYAARREQLVLKRFRVAGVPPVAMFGATALSVIAVVGVQSLAVIGALVAMTGSPPADPVMLVLSILLISVVMTLFGAVITRFARNAESAQMMAMAPFMLLIVASGFFVPLELLPDRLAQLFGYLPMVPAIELAQSAYFGHDFFAAATAPAAEPATGLRLWTAAVPALAILLAWTAVLAYSLRYFRWDPRSAK